MMGGSVLNEYDMCVRHTSVSSNENLAGRLTDGNDTTFWQSSGPQGKVRKKRGPRRGKGKGALIQYYFFLSSPFFYVWVLFFVSFFFSQALD